MKIITDERPPIFDACVARFPGADVAHAIFSYGDRIYNLSGAPLSQALLAHEMVHCHRQAAYIGMFPSTTLAERVTDWWALYLASDTFRLDEEVPAHAAEYIVASKGLNRHYRRATFKRIAERLAGPLYGRLISVDEAKRRILEIAI